MTAHRVIRWWAATCSVGLAVVCVAFIGASGGHAAPAPVPSGNVTFEVVPASPSPVVPSTSPSVDGDLPSTGAGPSVQLLWLGAGALAAGVVAVTIGVRHKRASTTEVDNRPGL